jgi:hypothetical protein
VRRHRISLVRIAAVVLLSSCAGATAHERWGDGTGIPAWVKQSCCGPADAHRLTVSQIKHLDEEGGWLVEGHDHLVPDSRVLPSQDGFVWIFYVTYYDGRQSDPLCFFIPQADI